MIKVSVIIPVYNTSKYLLRCLDSVYAQTLKEIEVIIVNDGSTDDSEKICRDYISFNKLDWKIFTKNNGGLSSARHYGWERSIGECIAFIDSDDNLHPDYCKLMYEAIKETDSDLAICGYNLCNGTVKKIYIPDFKKTIINNIPNDYGKRIILDTPDNKRLPGFLWMRMMKRDLISEECFIHENKVFAEDHIFDLEYSKSIKRIAVVKEALYNYYINPGSLTLKFRPNMLEMSSNLHLFYHQYLEAFDLLDDNSALEIARNKVDGIIASIINAIRFGTIKDVKHLFNKIKGETRYYQPFEYLNIHSSLTGNQKLWCFFIKRGITIIPYTYYNWRHRRE